MSSAAGARGAALLLTMLLLLLMSALASAVVVVASIEGAVAANHRRSVEASFAAEAMLERALADLPPAGDVDPVLQGHLQSTFVDGAPGGVRLTPAGDTIDLSRMTNQFNCGRPDACSEAALNAPTADRPWGPNNPRWRPFAYGPLGALVPPGAPASPFYIAAWVADDGAETDGDPARDGGGWRPGAAAPPSGTGIVMVRAAAFGPSGARAVLEAAVALTAPAAGGGPPGLPATGVRVLWWRKGIGLAP